LIAADLGRGEKKGARERKNREEEGRRERKKTGWV
jgi:hypothetical protein